MPPSRAHLVLQQIELRQRARQKFSRAQQMFFTAPLLEQATEERIAHYKASRFTPQTQVVDLCCGVGGDLLGIAGRGSCMGIDRDPIAICLAAANCRAMGWEDVRFQAVAAEQFDVAECDSWHIDPDRRPGGRRTTQLEMFEPSIQVLERLLAVRGDGAIKLAPATVVPRKWAEEGEVEWIGSRRECRQQVVWLGKLARDRGMRTATIVCDQGATESLSGPPDVHVPPASVVGRFVHEPHSAVLAARLAGTLAERCRLAPLAPHLVYLTGNRPVSSPLISAFEVLEVLPLDVKRLRHVLRARRIGRLEVKVRSAPADPEELRRQLRVSGDHAATLLVAGYPEGTRAILARRVSAPSS